MMADRIDLSGSSDLRHLGEAQRNSLAEQATVEEYGKGDYVFSEGEPASTVCFVIEGRIDLEVQTMRGTPVVLDVLGPGDLLGWSACLGTGSATASSHCQSAVRLIKIEGEVLRNVLKDDADKGLLVMMEIAKTIARRLRESRTRLTHLLGDYV